MKRTLALFVVLVLSVPTMAQEMKSLDKPVVATIEAAIVEAMGASKMPGLSVAVGKEGELLWAKGYGAADVELGALVNAETRFRTASIAKTMTAVAVLKLVEAGQVDLDAKVSTYVKEWSDPKKGEVTVRHLLGHLSGVRHYKGGNESSGTRFFGTLGSTLRLFAEDPLVQDAGTKYLYSTFAYTLLGMVVESRSGKTFREFMEGSVWEPAGMKSTAIDDQWRILRGRSKGYSFLKEGAWKALDARAQSQVKVGDLVHASLHDTSMKIPGGGFVSTPSDLVRFGLELLNGKLLKPETLLTMAEEQKTSAGEGTGYGLGIGIDKKSDGAILSHSGGQAGTSSMFMMDRKSGTVVAVMANADGMPVGALARKILESVAPSTLVVGEPERVRVAHILVAFRGASRSAATRTREEAEALAEDLLKRAKAGEDFDALMKEFSNDPGGGTYGLVNDGQAPAPSYYPRRQMVPAFGNVGFKLRVGEVGMAPHDPTTSPFGWHVIKRIE